MFNRIKFKKDLMITVKYVLEPNYFIHKWVICFTVALWINY